MTIIHSSDLGWKAGQDISSEFAALAKTFKSGDTFVFDHMYDISGARIRLPDNFTLAGGSPGAGVDVIDSGTNSAPVFFLGHNNTLTDLTVTHSNSPQTDRTDLGAAAKGGVDFDFKRTFVAENKNDIKVLNSHFEGNIGIFLDVAGGKNLFIQDTEFDGGYNQIRFYGSVTNPTIDNTLFQNSLGDGIKTGLGSNSEHTKNATVTDSVFLNNLRDGIDTTGGFKDSVISNSYFVGNGVSGMDLKSGYNSESDFAAGGPVNANILVTNSEFIDTNVAIVVTTLDKAGLLTPQNAQKWAIQNILLKDSIVENSATDGSTDKMFLVKDSYDIHWEDVTLLGNVVQSGKASYYNTGLPTDVNGTSVTTGSPRSIKPDSYYQEMAGPDWSDISYPTDGPASTPTVDPVITPDPISYGPTPEPTPTPEVVVTPTPDPDPDPIFFAPSPTSYPIFVDPDPVVVDPIPDPVVVTPPTLDTGSTSFPSKLLNVYLAYADTDATLGQIGDGTNVNNGLTDGRKMTIYASSKEGAPSVGSVRLTVEGIGTRYENIEPFAIFGDDGNGDFFGGQILKDGTYKTTITSFEGKDGSGKRLEKVSFDFTVGNATTEPVVTAVSADDPVMVTLPPEADLQRDAAPLSPDSQLINISLIDTGTDTAIADLYQGAKLNSDDLEGLKLTLAAEALGPASAEIGSMRLELDRLYNNIENVSPYALFGDDDNGNFFNGLKLSDGTHFARLTAYAGKDGKGAVLDKVTVEFQIGDYDSVIVGGTSSVVSSYSSAQDKGTATVSENQMSVELEGSAWKSLDHFKQITEMTVMKVDFKSTTEGEIQGIGFSNGQDDLSSTFFQLDGSQELGIQAFNDQYETGSGSDTYIIPVGQFFTGEFDELVLINDDDAGLGASSVFENISFFEAVA